MKTSSKIREALLGSAKSRKLRRREPLLLQGDISQHIHFVESGCLREWHNNDGLDITFQFFLSGEFVASATSLFKQEPSKFSIEAVVPTVVRTISRKSLLKAIAQSQETHDYMFDALVTRLGDYQELFLNRIMESPENRYCQLVEQNPQLFETVPQHYIASYLGVTPVSLSRIRKRVEPIGKR